ncbi:MAG: dicarboxylate/amino acid:cation symporter [Gammaproteobacteria bacterium]|nr:dicarboxylate/amino acid:cation symporter [Gammaproteobacteria bacterium]MBU1654648.1 dicarboxylate/amino acid:cation symporter [Gammaproteobacteria bacterium]MBU1960441.1 dicarboxylate/amino acid:cation symporter [Gammaproteobacteria bacterium]
MRLKRHWQIPVALIVAVLAGLVTGLLSGTAADFLIQAYGFLGTLFLNALKMLIVPLVVASIITGVASVGQSGALGRLGGRTLLYYLSTSLFAILVGLLFVNLIDPGIDSLGNPVKPEIDRIAVEATLEKVGGKGFEVIPEIFLRMVPANIVAAAADGQMLGLIFFSLLFGYFMTRIDNEGYTESLYNFWRGIFDVMMRITDLVMKFAPIGVFGLVAKVVATTGFSQFASVGWFFIAVLAGLAVHAFVTLPLLLSLVGGVDPRRHFRAMSPALLTAFSTASSAATLPLTLECVEQRAGVSNRTTSFVLPLGATVNMDGTALYECAAAMFIAQAYGLELTFATQFTIVVIALLTSIGVAAVPSASLVAISIILGAIGLPLEAVGLLLVVDRILDMCRTSVNVLSDSCGAVIIGRLEGEANILQQDPEAARYAQR